MLAGSLIFASSAAWGSGMSMTRVRNGESLLLPPQASRPTWVRRRVDRALPNGNAGTHAAPSLGL